MLKCKPDVAIRRQVKERELDVAKWPLLWACEIKLGPYPKNDNDEDAKKLRGLLEQRIAEHACWIRLKCDRKDGYIQEEADKTDGRFRIYEA